MKIPLWSTAIAAAVLFAAQTALAETRVLVARYVLTAVVLLGVALWVQRGRAWRATLRRAPEPIVLALAALAGLSVWAPAWWLMDACNYALERTLGLLPLPLPVLDVHERWLGVELQPLAYELGVLFAVLIVPLLSAWLLWGSVQPALERMVGRRRAAWLAGGVGGAFWALIAVQGVAPALPWGLAALPGYVLIGLVAAHLVALSGSLWAGFAVQLAFAYASFAWRDDLFRAVAGKAYWDPAWLTALVLGGFGVFFFAQVIRARTPRPPEPPRSSSARGAWGALVLMLVAVIALAAWGVHARRAERLTDAAASPPTSPATPTRPAP